MNNTNLQERVVSSLLNQVAGLKDDLAKADKKSCLVDTSTVIFTGENSAVSLRATNADEDSTRCAHWRAVHSPAGPGTVLFIQSADCWGKNVKIYADNHDLARFIQAEFESLMRPHFAQLGDPIITASFSRGGSTLNDSYSEIVTATEEKISVTWSSFKPDPFLIRFEVGSVFAEHGVYSNIMPAETASITVHDKDGGETVFAGGCYDSDMAGQPCRSAFLALGETWLKRGASQTNAP